MPLGETRVVGKRVNPVWGPPASIRAERPELPAAVPPGPDNPLGTHALDLGWTAHVIHGTNKPLGVGRRVSHGCIRMYPEDIKELFAAVAVGTRVAAVDQPVKVGWRENVLYVEVHPTPDQTDEIEIDGRFTPAPDGDVMARVTAAADAWASRIDRQAVERAARERRGLPVVVARKDDARR
jgi:L,D-transpeptidase ErfK/SrfK